MKLARKVISGLLTTAIAATITLASTTPVAAAPGNMQWTTQSLPTGTSNVLANGSDVTDIAVASDGNTVYVADEAQSRVYKSTDAGQSFTRLTAYEAIGGVAAPTAIGVASDNASAIAVTDGSMVYYSNNGGTTWTTLTALPSASANATITDVAVGPARAGTVLGREYAVSVADPSDNATDTANQQGDVLIIGEIATWASAAATTGITGDMDYMAVAFSPNFVGDRCLVAVGASVGSGNYTAGVYLHLLNNAQGQQVLAPTALHTVATDYRTVGVDNSDIVAADVALPSDFDPTTGSGRRAYVGIGTAATFTNDDVYRVDNTEFRALGAVVAQPIKSVAYSGNITDGALFIGQNNNNTIKFSTNPQVPLPTWTTCKKNPGLAANTATVVRVAADFATTNRVFSGTRGEESAFNVSNNGGDSFDAEALIDNGVSDDTVEVQSIRLTPDGNWLFVATDDGTHVSLWKSATPVTATSWSRVYVTAGTQGMVRVNPGWAVAPVIYFANLVVDGSLYRSADGGDIFVTKAAPAGTVITDMAVEDADTVYVAAGASAATATSVYKSITGAWTWELPVSAEADAIVSLEVAKADHLIVGGTDNVSYSTDGGTSFNQISDGLTAGTYQVLADDGYASDNTIYAGGTDGNIYRFIIGESTSWQDLSNPITDPIVGLEMKNEVIYSASANATDRNLDPRAATATVAATWDTMDAGAPANVTSFTTASGSNVLYAANSGTTLWAYNDVFATTKPVLTSPANGATVPIDPVTGLAILPITLAWQPVGTGIGAGNRVDIWIKEKASGWSLPLTFSNVSVNVTSPQFILTADWCAAANLTMTAGTEYEWRVRYDDQVSGDTVRTPWSDPFTIKVSAPPALPAGGGVARLGQSDLSLSISPKGTVLRTVTTKSFDNICQLTLEKGTTAKTKYGTGLSYIYMIRKDGPPPPPQDCHAICFVYDFGPSETTFNPPATLTLCYNASAVPEGVPEENLVIAYWDAELAEWVGLGSMVNTETNTITSRVSHLTLFTILGFEPKPAAFNVGSLVISPGEIEIGESLAISVLVTNAGEKAGSYKVTLTVNDIVEASKEVTLDGGASQKVTFTTGKDTAGTYAVSVDGLSGTFTVRTPAKFVCSDLSITPSEIDIGEGATISVLVTNTGEATGTHEVSLEIDSLVESTKEVTLAGGASQKVTFAVAKDVAKTYTVAADGLSGTFIVKVAAPPAPPALPPPTPPTPPAPLTPPEPLNWWLVVGIVSIIVVVVPLIYRFVRRRRKAQRNSPSIR